jgi:hypothetical protein
MAKLSEPGTFRELDLCLFPMRLAGRETAKAESEGARLSLEDTHDTVDPSMLYWLKAREEEGMAGDESNTAPKCE